jgi:hypothetical protein
LGVAYRSLVVDFRNLEQSHYVIRRFLTVIVGEDEITAAHVNTNVDVLESGMTQPRSHDDQHNAALPGLAQVIARTASRMTTWLSHPRLKYLNIRVDMRGGNFVLTDYYGKEASDDVMTLLKIPKINN